MAAFVGKFFAHDALPKSAPRIAREGDDHVFVDVRDGSAVVHAGRGIENRWARFAFRRGGEDVNRAAENDG